MSLFTRKLRVYTTLYKQTPELSYFSKKVYDYYISGLLFTREIPTFGGISLALRGDGAYGAAFRAPSVAVKEKKNVSGAFGAPFRGRLRRP